MHAYAINNVFCLIKKSMSIDGNSLVLNFDILSYSPPPIDLYLIHKHHHQILSFFRVFCLDNCFDVALLSLSLLLLFILETYVDEEKKGKQSLSCSSNFIKWFRIIITTKKNIIDYFIKIFSQ